MGILTRVFLAVFRVFEYPKDSLVQFPYKDIKMTMENPGMQKYPYYMLQHVTLRVASGRGRFPQGLRYFIIDNNPIQMEEENIGDFITDTLPQKGKLITGITGGINRALSRNEVTKNNQSYEISMPYSGKGESLLSKYKAKMNASSEYDKMNGHFNIKQHDDLSKPDRNVAVNKKVVHILPDRKFVSQIDKFRMHGLKNRIVFWGNGDELPPDYHPMTVYLSPQKKNIPKLVSECKNADLVIVYSLLSEVVLSLPKELTIIWRFFGYEIYEKENRHFLSKNTWALYKKTREKPSLMRMMKDCVLYFFPSLSLFNRSIKRVNYFMGVFYEEYQFIESLGFELPPFIQTPINFPNISFRKYPKKPVILLGNSRVYFNNHIDIIQLLKDRKKDNLAIKMLFSYGQTSQFTQTIKQEAQKVANMEILEDFVGRDEFENMYREAAAVVINSYRQMALGNIFVALRTGTKIYLSRKNVTYHWLKKNGFKVFLIEEDLQRDLATSDIFLSTDDAEINFNRIIHLTKKYTKEDFHHRIKGILNSDCL